MVLEGKFFFVKDCVLEKLCKISLHRWCFWKKMQILVEEIRVDDHDGDDEPKGFREQLQSISYCCLWESLD
jgi:hypothetical protein